MSTNRIPGLLAACLLLAMTTAAAAQSSGAASALPNAREQYAAAKDQALEQVLLSARGDNPFLRANAIEAIQSVPNRALPMAQLGLNDDHPVVRFSALVTIGKLRFESLLPAVQRLRNDPSPSVRAAALYAAKRLGAEVDLSPMAAMLQASNPGLRGNVAMLLGLMGDSTAVPMMQEMTQNPIRRATATEQALVRLQVAEAVIQLGDESALDAVRAGVYSRHDEVRVLALQIMGRIDDRRMSGGLPPLLEDNPIEVRLAAAEALARLGSFAGLQTLLEGARSNLPTARAQAAFGLGLFNDPRAAQALVGLLSDSTEQVRLSAAASILRALGSSTSYRS